MQEVLDSINVSQAKQENLGRLNTMGGIQGLASKLGVVKQISELTGLSTSDVIDMRTKFGDNKFPDSPMESFLSIFFGSFEDTTLLILLCSAAVSLGVNTYQDPESGYIEGVAIFVAVFAVALITAGNDYTKEMQFRELEAATQKDEKTTVIRDGVKVLISADEVVVGDIVVLNTGDMVPADSIICDNKQLICNESNLTGEADDLKKSQERDPFLLSSCLVKDAEESRSMVIATGINSQWGKIKANLVNENVNTPLQDRLEDMTMQIGYIGLAAAIAIFAACLIRIFVDGKEIADGVISAFILAVTVVVAAIPEGLPLSVTIALAYSTKRMYECKINVRILASCETMGNATNICSDKTGTLTENRMTVVEGWFADKIVDESSIKITRFPPIVEKALSEQISVNRLAYLVFTDENGVELNRPKVVGNNTEGALILLARQWGINYDQVNKDVFNEQRDKLFAFNSSKKRSTVVVHNSDGTVTLYTKGASEIVLRDCTEYLDNTGLPKPLSESKRRELETIVNDMASRALRTLCLAHRHFKSITDLPADWCEAGPPDNNSLCCDAIVGIMDPLRPDVIDAVRIAQHAGVVVRMVTGDNLTTACAIARKCGILTEDGIALEGPEFRKMPPSELDKILPKLQVLGRSSPEDKYLLVTRLNGVGLPTNKEEWEKKYQHLPGVTWEKDRDRLLPGYREEWEVLRPNGGDIVAVTGDGTNDAPALKAADVGLAMGLTGTKVAQSAADVIITDDNFSSIVNAILWGRSVYDNIRKFLQFQLTINVVALLLIFIGASAGTVIPLTAVQLLWVNLIMDTLAALALATEPPDNDLMNRKPYTRSASLVNKPMWRNITVQSFFQLSLLLFLLFLGPTHFGFHSGEWCKEYSSNDDLVYWDVTTSMQIDNLQEWKPYNISCASFNSYCPDGSGDCYEETQKYSGSGENGSLYFSFEDLNEYSSQCLTCEKVDFTHGTIIFNTFIFCQVFNEFTMREIGNRWNVISGAFKNKAFIGVVVFTIIMQVLIVQFGGAFASTTSLSITQWALTIGLAFLGLPLGMLMRFIPAKESDDNFFSSKATSTNDDLGKNSIFAKDIVGSGAEYTSKFAALSPKVKMGGLGVPLLSDKSP